MSAIVTEGTGNIPEQPTLVMPNRVTPAIMLELEKALGGSSRVAWLVESSLRPAPEIMQHLQQTRAAGTMFSLDTPQAQVVENLRRFAEQRRHLVLLPGRPAQLRASLCDVTARLLTFFDGSPIPALPVYCGMFNSGPEDTITTHSPSEPIRLRILPPIKPGAAQSARIYGSWLEASADLLSHHPLAENASLPHLLISALKAHPDACIIDGIDDTQLTHLDVLVYAFRLSRLLKRHTSHRRLGIILPPGKLATIANVACILAGISPVNINFLTTEENFRHIIRKSGITRFITEERFVAKQREFPWPRTRDLIFIEQELADMNGGKLGIWRMILRMMTPEQIAHRLRLPDTPTPDKEATLLFTGAASGEARGAALTHRMLMTALASLQSRLELVPGDRILSSLPLYHSLGLSIGLLMPLVYGYDMVTYPSPVAARRLCELISNYDVRLVTATPALARHMFNLAGEDTFESVTYFITGSDKLTTELALEARQRFRLNMLDAYTLTEACPLVALNLPSPTPLEGEQSIPSARNNTVGAPLPGMAVRISDASRVDQILPLGAPGLIWVKGASVLREYLDDEAATSRHTRGTWLCTDDIGKLDADGLLTIMGRRTRFSKIGGEVVSHEHVEHILRRVLKIKPDTPERKIAIIGIPDSARGEQLILLSAVHKTAHPHDLITIRYGIMNEGFPSLWCPERILPVPAIPVLPNGKLDYPACYALATGSPGKPTR